ncbi:MAG: xanthine dehydrogenase family protein molybdopterin-binding subunit [Nitrososphaerota archaeon]
MALEGMQSYILGKGKFVDDFYLPGMLYLKVVRSNYARARILRVKGEITGHELKAVLPSVGEGGGAEQSINFPVLATQSVNFVGQPVAAVLGKDRYEAEDAADSVEVEYEPLKPVVDPEQALISEPIHPGTSSNEFGKVEMGKDFEIKDASIVIEKTLKNERIIPNPIEPRGVVTDYDGSTLTVWISTQSVHSIRGGMATALGIDKNSIRVIQTDTGGAFGTKSALYPEYVIAAYASMKLRRPVKWIESRSEHLVATNQGRGARARMKVYADAKGKVLGIKSDILVDGGAYPVGIASFAPRFIGYQITGPYAIKNVYVKARGVFTNKVPLGPYRGAGRPEAAFFVERMMDAVAKETGIDPVEVRLENAASEQFVSPLGLKVDPLKPFLQKAARELGYVKGSNNIGFSSFVLVSSAQPGESARIKVSEGIVNVWLGGSSHGQGHEGFVKKLVQESLHVPEGKIAYHKGDTKELDEGVGSWGSRSAIMGGMALLEAIKRIKDQVKAKHGSYSVDELLKGDYEAKVFYTPSDQSTSLGANLVEVERDTVKGIRIKRIVAYYDVGRALNPAMIESQVIGGSIQAVGQVLYEVARYNEDGQPLVGSIADAGLPTAVEAPHVMVKLAEIPSALEHKAKGVGESPTIGVPPALVKAIENVINQEIHETPIPYEQITKFFA